MDDNGGKQSQPINSPLNQSSNNLQPQSVPNVIQQPNPQAQTVQQTATIQQNIQVASTSGIDTPEGLPGGLRLRLSAAFFDNMIYTIPISYIGGLIGFLTNNYSYSGVTSLIIILVFLAVVTTYFVYFDISKGATPGKRIYGLKVVDINSRQNLSLKKATIRELTARATALVPFIGALFQLVNFFVMISSSERRGIHDRLANSQVLVVEKSWSVIKQLGLFLLLIVVSLAPLAFIVPGYLRHSEEIQQCQIECLQSLDTENMSTPELQKELNNCGQKCSSLMYK